MSDLEPRNPATTPGRPSNSIAAGVSGAIRRFAAGRLNSLNVLLRAHPSDLALIVALAVIGLVVRLVVLDTDMLHEDESLYASYGLHIAQTGDWFLHKELVFPVDKIPLFYWAEAVVISWLGNTPLSIRLVDLAASLATIGAVYMLARDLSGRVAGWAAGLAMAVSPFAILFGASVFTDPFAIAFGFGALAVARRDHAVSAGVLVGLALGGKLFGLLYLPLALVLLLTVDAPRRRSALIAFLVAFGITAGALLGFMALRTYHYGVPWFLSAQLEGVGGVGLTNPAEWNSRISAWWAWLGYFAESDPLRLMAAIGLVGALVAAIRNRGRLRWAIAALCAFSPAYFVFLVVEESPTYDRYLFYLLPTLCVAVGIGVGEVLRIVRSGLLRRGLLLACTVFVLSSSIPIVAQAEAGAFPVGARSDAAFAGYRELCSWLQARPSTQQVVWDHSLSWTLGYCMIGYPESVWWYPDAATVVPIGSEPTYLALSQLDDPQATVAAVRARGLTVTLVETAEAGGHPNLWIYQVLPATATPGTP